MRPLRARSTVALLAGASCGLLLAAPTGAFAAAHHPTTTSKAAAHPKGLFITGQGKVSASTNGSAFVRDQNGGEHLITTVANPSAPGQQGHIVYITKKASATTFRSLSVPGLHNLAGGVDIEAHLSGDGTRVFAVFYGCDGASVADASIGSTRLPTPTVVQSANNCTSGTPSPTGPPTALAVPYGSREVGVLLDDPAQSNKPALFVGAPGGTFKPQTALPTANSFVPEQLAYDSRNDSIVAVGTGSDGTNVGIYYSTQRYGSAPWSTPKELATLNSPTRNYTLESATSYNSSIWIGLLKPKSGAKHTQFDVHIGADGQNSGVVPLVHTTNNDTSLRLLYNSDTGHLHAVWTRVISSSKAKKSGIFHEALIGGSWAKPQQLTKWYRDTAQQVTFTPGGHPFVSYEQR
jgi:hypothetical protein